jgi:hypothetical protein
MARLGKRKFAIGPVQVTAPPAWSRAPRADATADALLAASKGDWIDADEALGCGTCRFDGLASPSRARRWR